MAKRALIVGINYPGTNHELRGCVNDANLIKKTITEQYGFTDVRRLLDDEATTAGILDGLYWLVDGATPGDILYFHFSGHGSQLLDRNGDEKDGLDEIICPADLDWDKKVITDDKLKSIFDSVPAGVNLTVTLDCCNSGGGLDQANQYQSLGEATRGEQAEGRYLPPPNRDDAAIYLEERVGFKKKAIQRNVDATGLLISGCQSHQTSADAYIDGGYIGACTYYLVKNLEKNEWSVNYKTLVDSMNTDLAKAGYTQRPELNGSAKLFGDEFLQKTGQSIADGEVEVVEGVDYIEPSKPNKKDDDDDKKGNKTILIIGAIIALAALAFSGGFGG